MNGAEGDVRRVVMADIVERLRKQEMWWPDIFSEAADEITILRGKNERLRAALRDIASHTTNPEGSGPAYGMVGKLVRIARAALGGER